MAKPGYTVDQLHQILAQLATEANALATLARETLQTPRAETLYCILMGLEHMGLIADLPSGGDNIGGPEEWLLGDSFKSEGASHG